MTLALDKDFTAGSLGGSPTITFTHAATAGTYIDSSGVIQTGAVDTARFTHDPASPFTARGLMLEEQRTNYSLYNEALDGNSDANYGWAPFDITYTSNATTAPDGNSTAYKVIADNVNTEHTQYQTKRNLTGANTLTFSFFAKSAGLTHTYIYIESDGLGWKHALYHLHDGTVDNIDAGCSASIIPYANSWYRCTFTFTVTSNTYINTRMYLSDGSLNYYAGNNSDGAYWWGMQLEIGSSPTSYIGTTTTATVTRSADVATMTGTDFSSWYNQTEGTFYVEGMRNNVAVAGIIVQADGGSEAEVISLGVDASANPILNVIDGSSPQTAPLDAGTMVKDTAFTFCAAYKLNNFGASFNSATEVADTTGTIPTPDRLRLGASSVATNWNGTLAKLKYYDVRIADTASLPSAGSTITAAILAGGYSYMGSGQTRAILPAGVGAMG